MKTLPQQWTKGCGKIHEIMQNRFIYGGFI